jgi:Ca2+-binding RTX toxin-like protein
LPTGSFFYKHPLGGFRHPSPSAIATTPALEFTTYVNVPSDNGLNNPNTLILGGFPGLIPSLGDPSSNHPGTFSIFWGDLIFDPPGTFQIARWTFPQGILPESNPFSFTAHINKGDANLYIVQTGGSGNDLITGYTSANFLDGGPGNDTIDGDDSGGQTSPGPAINKGDG